MTLDAPRRGRATSRRVPDATVPPTTCRPVLMPRRHIRDGGELRRANGGHHPGRAHRAGTDADLDDVGAGIDQVAGAVGGDDIASRDRYARSSARTAASASRILRLVPVRGVHDEQVDACGGEVAPWWGRRH